jgi:ADP-ribose pyrophosphatase YjhB (NUDIX family)
METILPLKKYKEIAGCMPIMCVDGVIVKDGKYLLVKRNNEPLKGEYWTPGGRIYKGEKLKDGIIRKIKEETGLVVKPISIIGIYEDFYKKNELGLALVHTVSIVFVCSPISGEIKLDSQSVDYKWSKTLPKGLNLQLTYF